MLLQVDLQCGTWDVTRSMGARCQLARLRAPATVTVIAVNVESGCSFIAQLTYLLWEIVSSINHPPPGGISRRLRPSCPSSLMDAKASPVGPW